MLDKCCFLVLSLSFLWNVFACQFSIGCLRGLLIISSFPSQHSSALTKELDICRSTTHKATAHEQPHISLKKRGNHKKPKAVPKSVHCASYNLLKKTQPPAYRQGEQRHSPLSLFGKLNLL